MLTIKLATTLAVISFVALQSSGAKDPPIPKKVYDFTAGDILPDKVSHDWTLGATGARGWCQVWKGLAAEGNTEPSRQILITQVAEGSPAEIVLKKGDVILGIGDSRFDCDARVTFAKALGAAQAVDGKLALQRFRDGKTERVTVSLPKLPAFSKTAPYRCEKSNMIYTQGCESLSKRGIGEPSIPSDLNALALLASGDNKYLDQVKAYVRRRAEITMSPTMSLPCWHFAFKNILLSEYYLLTKDEKVLPEIKHLTHHLVVGRGPLSTWGHSFADPTDQRLRGYGAVNAVGIPVVISLVLARECGVAEKNLDQTIADSAQFFRRHIGLGAIPYGDGSPTTRYGHDDNGKNSAAALLFNLLGDRTATRYYARTAMAAYGSDREQGHTGNFFNILWSLPAVALGGEDATGMWLQEFGWYYDLARDPKHYYRYQGYPNERADSAYAMWDSSGAYLLHFAVAKKQLRITGKISSSISAFTTEENEENIRAGRVSYQGATKEELEQAMRSWSPVARARAAEKVRTRGVLVNTGNDQTANDPLKRVAAAEVISNFEEGVTMLEDKDLRVRLAAMAALSRLDKSRAIEAVFGHLVKVKKESPVFTQKVCDIFYPLGSRGRKIGVLLGGIKDRELAIAAVKILLNDEDALVASGIAMGVGKMPKKEQKELLITIYDRAQNPPSGNVMFVNGLRTACVKVLAQWELQEGLDIAVELLTDHSWGRNARLPKAAAVVSSYGGHAQSALFKIEKTYSEYAAKGDSRWTALLKETVDTVKESPKVKSKLKTLSDLR